MLTGECGKLRRNSRDLAAISGGLGVAEIGLQRGELLSVTRFAHANDRALDVILDLNRILSRGVTERLKQALAVICDEIIHAGEKTLRWHVERK